MWQLRLVGRTSVPLAIREGMLDSACRQQLLALVAQSQVSAAKEKVLARYRTSETGWLEPQARGLNVVWGRLVCFARAMAKLNF